LLYIWIDFEYMAILISLFPVFFFLVFLFLLDSFKLVIKKYLFFAVLWGTLSAIVAYFLHTFLIENTGVSFEILSRYIAPATEETLKALFIFFMIYKKRVGFMIDAAIYGFAVGAGFALIEGSLLLNIYESTDMLFWLIRGLGTSIMHGGCTALLSALLLGSISRKRLTPGNIAIALLIAYAIHSLFNHFSIDPLIQTASIIIVLPVLLVSIFKYNENQLQHWLEIEFNSEVQLLAMINKGKILFTRSGEYLASLKSRFSGETILDMYCFISLYLELSIIAKRNVMLKECGFPVIIEKGTEAKLRELHLLRRSIGKVGELTLSPLIRLKYRDLWKLNTLK